MRSGLLILCGSAAIALGANIKTQAPERVPDGASKAVEHDFASFSLPFHFFPDYAGKSLDSRPRREAKHDITRK